MKLRKYRLIDLTIFAFIMVFMQVVGLIAQTRLHTTFVLSITIVLLIILTVRWGLYTLIHAVLLGFVFAFMSYYIDKSMSVRDLLVNACIYGIGNCFVVVDLLLLKLIGKERLASGGWWLILYAVVGFASVCLGRAVVGVFFRENFLTALNLFFTTESLNFILAVVILFITNKQENMLKDQKDYFLEVRAGGKNEN